MTDKPICAEIVSSKRVGGTDEMPIIEVRFCTLKAGHTGKHSLSEEEHIPSVDCWCKPYPADEEELVWVHRDSNENTGNA
jgi:hypothetical protein